MKPLLLSSLIFAGISGCTAPPNPVLSLDDATEQVELFGEGVVSTDLYERDIAIAPDGQELIYSLGDYKQRRRVLVMLRKNGKEWSPQQIFPFSGRYNDIEPFYSNDGGQLYFASDRPIDEFDESSDYNIWVVQKDSGNWINPQPLGPEVNSIGDEFFPAVSKIGNLYFTAARDNGLGREDIFISRFFNGKFNPAEPLDSQINTSFYEFNAYVNPDEDLIIFTSYGRDDDLGGGDLYLSRKDKLGNWKKAINLGTEINSNKLDYCPFLDLSNDVFYFTSERTEDQDYRINTVSEFGDYAHSVQNGFGNIYRVKSSVFPKQED